MITHFPEKVAGFPNFARGDRVQCREVSSVPTIDVRGWLNIHSTYFKAAIKPPKRIATPFSSLAPSLAYASQHIFLMFRIILSVSVFMHLST